ncbi:hypothetical protein A2917_03295 [Candidatus Nomurabacteria bacterium RIFCSPLOWO2_01_FULL_42_17]|uniref:Uncharacterized protein n=1 Tax=Candidatus Nomurabacteria bacterium RIFCSPLOWO2_01_FULL_42_17 TaxID=1801780 RepID=A0A1F6XMZ3_9BACT|nr:MAG: hypothetical protein A2917_03295 [Candidatus Nomurabacteria bacterium RIFCSPLOWO2_01_FULL_42_17]
MDNLKGTIIEESLEDKSLLSDLKIVSTKVEDVTDKHKTPWIKQWTLHKVEIDVSQAQNVAERLSKALDSHHLHSWYADFKNENTHYVIYRDKVFKIDRTKKEEYDEATKYGLSLGIPSYQIDFEKNVKKWER